MQIVSNKDNICIKYQILFSGKKKKKGGGGGGGEVSPICRLLNLTGEWSRLISWQMVINFL